MPKVALFVGSDVSTHLVLNDVIPRMMALGLTPEIHQVHETPHAQPRQLEDLAFYERTLPASLVYPFVAAHPVEEAKKGLQALAAQHGITYKVVHSVNSAEYVQSIADDPDMLGGVSIRNYQKFKPEIIQAFKKKGFLWNLHPGDIPPMRGVLPPFRVLQKGLTENVLSLHEVDENYDTGNVILKLRQAADPAKSMFAHYLMLGPSISAMVASTLKQYVQNGKVETYPQQGKEGYYSYPAQQELDLAEGRGIFLINEAEKRSIADFYVSTFHDPSSAAGQELKKQIVRAVEDWQKLHPLASTFGAADTHPSLG